MSVVEGEGSADDSPMDAALDPLERSAAAGKTQKRKFTAWTHQDEQSFFSALRKVGKNFDKITARVQGKNRDQVRHYYYRLTRRLNKLLGPGSSLDVKNSMETIAAMLRWWSLLENFGCRASKLHLKPHIYNKFVQTLGNDLLKDRKRTKRNCLPGEIHMSSQSPYLCKPQGSEFLPVKVMAADAQEFSKTAVSKGESLKQIVEPKSNALRTTKQKSRSGTGMNHMREEDPQPSAKLKLHLFPINEDTKKALEKGEHNPHLELILCSRKKISTVVEHLNKKWGSPNNESGEFMLFPYSAEMEDLTTYHQWTMEDNATIADVFLSVSSPSIFRLRYGWFPLVEFQTGVSEINSSHFNNLIHGDIKSKCKDTLEDDCMPEQRPDNPEHQSMLVCDMPSRMRRDVALPEKSINTHSSQRDRQKQIHSSGAIPEEEWEDTLTNIGMGYLLAETSGGVVPDCLDPFLDKNDLHNGNFDSSNDDIVSHISCWQSATMPENVYPAIWGPEEACDALLFGLAADWKQEGLIDSSNSPVATYRCNPGEFQDFLQVYTSQNLAGAQTAKDPLINGMGRDVASTANSPRRLRSNDVMKDCSIYDIRWPDLFESLDCEMTSPNYQDCDIMFADSCMLESSLDSSGNLPFFSMENSCIPFADI